MLENPILLEPIYYIHNTYYKKTNKVLFEETINNDRGNRIIDINFNGLIKKEI